MTLYYESSTGEIIDFLSDGIYAQDPENLTENTWKYNTISSITGVAKVKNFYKEVEAAKLTLSIAADSKEEFNEKMARMHRIFERDLRTLEPGKIWWNEFYKEAFIYASSNSDFEELMDSVEHTIEVLSTNSAWIKKYTTQFISQEDIEAVLDYPRDYSYDYDRSEMAETLNNTSIGPANYEMIFYGPATDPEIMIAGNIYALETELNEGEYAIVNTITKKIEQHDNVGNVTNIFDRRDRENNIFTKIPEGVLPVLRKKTIKVDVTIYDERGEPTWI